MAKISSSTKMTAAVIGKTLLSGEDYRMEIVNFINKEFMNFAIKFFQKVVNAKMRNREIGMDWYRKVMMSERLPTDEIATNAGINKKTVSNVHGTATREVVIRAAYDNYEYMNEIIKNLADENGGVDLKLTIKLNQASVELNINESLIVINALAVKRAAIRGGAWSSIGKRAEKPLMLTLCKLYSVPPENYDLRQKKTDKAGSVGREIDFFLVKDKNRYKCEVKLMGKGNPESIDAAFARESDVFVADTLSNQNIEQLTNWGVEWVHLKEIDGYRHFGKVLQNLKIPHKEYTGNLEKEIHPIIKKAIEEFQLRVKGR